MAKDSVDLRSITIAVASFGRQRFLARLLDFWADKGPRVLIVDGSGEPLGDPLLRKYAEFLTYIHAPVGIYERFALLCEYVHTPYVILAGDDEFYVPEVLVKCISELEKNSDVVACGGVCLGFKVADGKVVGRHVYPKIIDNVSSMRSSDTERRVSFHMFDYVPSQVYSVCRSADWKSSWRIITRQEFSFFGCGELQFELAMSIAGKSDTLAEVLWFRSYGESAPIRGTDLSLIKSKSFDIWFDGEEFALERIQFVEATIEVIKKISLSSCGKLDYEQLVWLGLMKYRQAYCLQDKDLQSLRQKWSVMVRKVIKRGALLLNIELSDPTNKLFLEMDELLSTFTQMKIRLNRERLEQILNMIRKFHNLS